MIKRKEDIIAWLSSVEIEDYKINEDLTVDVNRSVFLNRKNLTEIPIQFGIVHGYFSISENKLLSLLGCPRKVFGAFCAESNELISLNGGPTYVEGDYIVDNNKLDCLLGVANTIYNNLSVSNNPLLNLKGLQSVNIGRSLNISKIMNDDFILDISELPKSVKNEIIFFYEKDAGMKKINLLKNLYTDNGYVKVSLNNLISIMKMEKDYDELSDTFLLKNKEKKSKLKV